jgi:hypothetical protein
MTEDTARKVANVVSAPRCRRHIHRRHPAAAAAGRVAAGLTALTGSIPVWLRQEVLQAWIERPVNCYDLQVSIRRVRPAANPDEGARGGPAAVLAIWRGLNGFYNSDDLTFASSIIRSALSLFPFFLLALAVLGDVSSNEAGGAIVGFILTYFLASSSSSPTAHQFEESRVSSWGLPAACCWSGQRWACSAR